MRDLDASFSEILETLEQARDAVNAELELLHANGIDQQSALRILEAIRSFADQAQAVAGMMTDRAATPASLSHANDLAAFFWGAEESVEGMLGLSRS